jgi:hypothetical protein
MKDSDAVFMCQAGSFPCMVFLYIFLVSKSKKPAMEKRFLNSILNSMVDSADEMSFIYDIYSETEVIIVRTFTMFVRLLVKNFSFYQHCDLVLSVVFTLHACPLPPLLFRKSENF